ncbi:MAG: peptidoglycan-binding domain-containing protein [Pseudomonadota bacterium]
MDDIVGEHRKKAVIPISASLLTLAFGVAVSWNALNGQTGSQPAKLVAEQKTQATSISDLLQRTGAGDQVRRRSDPMVRKVQEALGAKNIYGGEVDGLNGPATRSAVQTYREKYGLQGGEDGIAAVLEHLEYHRQIAEAAKAATTGSTSQLSSKTIGLIQTGLAELGYDPGMVDGKMGEKTKQAIRDFQRDRSMDPTGKPTRELLSELRKVTGLTSLSES